MKHHSIHDSVTSAKMIWVLLCQAAVVIPHLAHLKLWIIICCMLIATWGYQTVSRHWRYPGMIMRFTLVILACLAVAYSYHSIVGRDAGVALLIIMMTLKLLEMRTHRDVMLFVFLGYFIVITNFLFSQSIAMAVYMLLVCIGLTATLVMLSRHDKSLNLYANFRHATIMIFQAIPFMLVLFVLFPRLPGPLWMMPNNTDQAVSGLSDSMTPGSISKLIRSDAVAFRVRFETKIPDSNELYWRGPVLTTYDGRTWKTATHRDTTEQLNLKYTGAKTSYTITLEPHKQKWLFALEMPAKLPASSYLNNEYTLTARKNIQNLYQYTLDSYTRYTLEPNLSESERRQYLQLPGNHNPASATWARELADNIRDNRQRIRYILDYFRQQEFHYTLSPPLLGQDPVDDFLFNTRQGFCEHYAGSFVYLMRLLDIPARVVLGYQGGEFNKLGDYMIIKQSDAHAWAEVWLSEKGWSRIDPTSAVSPERVEAGIDAALPDRVASGGLARQGIPLFRQLALYWDSVNYQWDRWILGYNADKQKGLLQRLGIDANNWQHIAISIIASIGFFVGVLSLWLYLSNLHREKDSVLRLYGTFCNRLAHIGFQRLSYEGAKDFAQRVSTQRLDLKNDIETITLFYLQLRYERNPPQNIFNHFRNRIKQFRPALKKPEE